MLLTKFMNKVQSKFSAGCITAPVTVSFFVIEVHKYEDVQIMFDSMRLWGAWEIIPVLDPNASRSVRLEVKVMKALGLKK